MVPIDQELHQEVSDALPLAAALGARAVWHLAVAYDGTAYHGWQAQPGVPTVQSALAEKLGRLFRTDSLELAATSRTDAGVHALDQQISFPDPGTLCLEPARLPKVLNRWLPTDIRIKSAALREAGFNARRAACGKAYSYSVYTGPLLLPFAGRYAWHLPGRTFDLGSMRAAAVCLSGERDFASFGVNPKRELPTTVCTVHRLEIIPEGEWLFFNVIGSAFLYKMVRSLVGWLVQVGLGRRQAGETPAVLAARCRAAAADTAPAEGLFLARVFLEPGAWTGYQPQLPPWRAW